MPIMAANGQSDARGAAWLLAATAKGCLEDPSSGPGNEVALNNTYRLLEAFRSNLFFSLERTPSEQTSLGAESLALSVPSQSHLADVSLAIKHSLTTAFGGEDSAQAITLIEDALRKVTYPEKFGTLEAHNLEKPTVFFRELQDTLKSA